MNPTGKNYPLGIRAFRISPTFATSTEWSCWKHLFSNPGQAFVLGCKKPIGDIETTTLDDLGVKVGRAFRYAFDFGDDWQHQINVEAIEAAPSKGKYPKVIKRVGDSPPLYPDWNDEDDEE